MRRTIWARTLVAGAALGLLAAVPAGATVTPTTSGATLVSAMAAPQQVFPVASLALPPSGTPAGTSTSVLPPFPYVSPYAVLSTGDATVSDQPGKSTSADDGGTTTPTGGHGDSNYDTTILSLGRVSVPTGMTCLSFNFRFLSADYPSGLTSPYNDAFIAEVDNSTWTTSGSSVSAPNDFSTHTGSSGVNINGVGPVAVSAAEASDTTYDAATGLVTTKTTITPGPHTIFLSIFDQGDHSLDSAAFVDNLRFITEDASTCVPPFVAETPAPTPEPQPQPQPQPPAPPSNAFTVGSKIVFKSGSTTITITVPGPGVLQVAPTAGGSRAAFAKARAAKKKKPLIKTVKLNVAKAGKVKVTLKPTAAGKKVLKKKGKITQKMRITFTPTGGTPKSSTKTITIKRKVKKK